jgi:hypothetical protein
MKLKLIAFIILLIAVRVAAGQETISLPEPDRVRLAEAFRLNQAIGEHIWKGWSKTPFAVLLVTPQYEFLLNHPKPSPDFKLIGYDRLLRSNLYFRKTVYSKEMLATFPAVPNSGVSTIVVGQAENTQAKTSTQWVVTLFHEHFHQLQNTQPSYYADVKALNLSGGDETGMWMLNYPFPYERKEVQEQFALLSRLLKEAVEAKDRKERDLKLNAYLKARSEFEKSLSPDDYKYFSFQFWQEGVARYTEYRVAKFAAENYRPSAQFRSLKDFKSFGETARSIHRNILAELSANQLASQKRDVVYAFGAAEALLLDATKPSWRDRYMVDKFDLKKYY